MTSIRSIWSRLFLEERPSVNLSFFRIAAALTTGLHVIPTLVHLDENYFSTAFKTFNTNFFTPQVIELVQKSPEWFIIAFAWIFTLSFLSMLIGYKSQLSCVIMTLSCYYFYALNALHVGTLSWDILLVTLFVMCWTDYSGDYFSIDALRRGDTKAYAVLRPFFVQRLLQMQIAFTFFYTALHKVVGEGNWIKDNPVYYLMNYPSEGVVKTFLFRDYFVDKPQLCYWLGIAILVIEFSMIFLLFNRRTRIAAIYLGIFFHITLILTLDVPAIFFFLFPAQLLLFIDPKNIVKWIEEKRALNQSARRAVLVYDGNCVFCRRSILGLQIMDLFSVIQYASLHDIDLPKFNSNLTKEQAMKEIVLVRTDGSFCGGFFAIRRLSWSMPMLWPFIPIFYFPGMSWIGPAAYCFVAKNRYLLMGRVKCSGESCQIIPPKF